ncbi:type II toxin-antitoxin system HicA family toxin [Flavobacterium crocinum]|uniref:type II toxin-antitoxin system HicA family toxin n=1 Tax=Flavobacterium crocinum TaxID=2183896 RepID=UPI001F0BF0C0|nr:type II toxin-antitoxin system HicA family toxin [Flavobacterium crocinum]
MSSDDLFKILKADGWELDRKKGSHHIFKHPEKKGIVVLPHPRKGYSERHGKQHFKASGTELIQSPTCGDH